MEEFILNYNSKFYRDMSRTSTESGSCSKTTGLRAQVVLPKNKVNVLERQSQNPDLDTTELVWTELKLFCTEENSQKSRCARPMSYRKYLSAVIAAQGGQDQILKAKLHIIFFTNFFLNK